MDARKPQQKALTLAPASPKAAAAPVALAPLFDGGPKGPMEGRHQPFQFLAWAFHTMRFKRLGDRYFDPWDGKHQKTCQRIMRKARDDQDEVKRRIKNLWLHCGDNPEFYRFTPECLLNRWDDCHLPPVSTVGGRAAMRQNAREAERARIRKEIAGDA